MKRPMVEAATLVRAGIWDVHGSPVLDDAVAVHFDGVDTPRDILLFRGS